MKENTDGLCENQTNKEKGVFYEKEMDGIGDDNGYAVRADCLCREE